jgi:bacteriophage N4 adsorption protein B
VCPKDGPTNKAGCLNWVYAGIKHFEKENGITFEIFVMNDSEDLELIHIRFHVAR